MIQLKVKHAVLDLEQIMMSLSLMADVGFIHMVVIALVNLPMASARGLRGAWRNLFCYTTFNDGIALSC